MTQPTGWGSILDDKLTLEGPIVGGAEIDVSAVDYTPTKQVRWLMARVGGQVKVDTVDGSTITLTLQSGGLIGVLVAKVYSTGTTASGLVVGW